MPHLTLDALLDAGKRRRLAAALSRELDAFIARLKLAAFAAQKTPIAPKIPRTARAATGPVLPRATYERPAYVC